MHLKIVYIIGKTLTSITRVENANRDYIIIAEDFEFDVAEMFIKDSLAGGWSIPFVNDAFYK